MTLSNNGFCVPRGVRERLSGAPPNAVRLADGDVAAFKGQALPTRSATVPGALRQGCRRSGPGGVRHHSDWRTLVALVSKQVARSGPGS